MNDETRPSPDALLKALQDKDIKSAQGRLKIFLGMAAGVGKTYTMLESAQVMRKQGISVAVGIVNTHGREETAALLKGLKSIPQKQIEYKGIIFEELDIDAVLRIRPQVVLVDELAHTNVPGSRHEKRWQDVVEILENQIDVLATLNVQHIESLRDIIESITGIVIREAVPDSIIESATIEVVDLTPRELLQRLKEGKVYLGDKSVQAAQNFFQEDRLTALREIILRYAAEKVDYDLQEMVPSSETFSGWKPRERLLVAISDSPFSQKLIRTTRRLATNLHAPWIALYVSNGREEGDNKFLAANIALARDLGGEVIITHEPSVVEGIKRIANQRGISQIIIGRSPDKPFSLFPRKTLLDDLTNECRNIDIHVIRQEKLLTRKQKRLIAFSYPKNLYSYFLVTCIVFLVSAINWFFLPYTDYKIIGVAFLMTILLFSLFFRKAIVFFSALLFALIWEYFFIPPIGFEIPPHEDLALMVLYFVTAITTGILLDRTREHKEMLEKREKIIDALYNIVRQISTVSSIPQIILLAKELLEKQLNGWVEIVVQNGDRNLNIDKDSVLLFDEKERSAAIWVYENEKEAGWSTTTLPSSKNLYIPLKGSRETVGILVYKPRSQGILSMEDKNFLYSVAQQIANQVQRLLSEKREKQYEQFQMIEKLYEKILSRISFDFKQPLQSLQSTVNDIKNRYMLSIIKAGAADKIGAIDKETENMMMMVNNMSTLVDLSEGAIKMNKQACSVNDLIEQSCMRIRKTIDWQINVSTQNRKTIANIDPHLIEMLLNSLIRNSVLRSPKESSVEVDVKEGDHFIVIAVLDRGEKIPEEQLRAYFDPYSRLTEIPYSVIGSGLEMVKIIAKMHQGYIKVENHSNGVRFSLFLPKETI